MGYVEASGVVYFNDGTGKKYQPLPFGDGKGSIYGMATGDLHRDGWPDVVVARSDAPSFVMFNHPPESEHQVGILKRDSNLRSSLPTASE